MKFINGIQEGYFRSRGVEYTFSIQHNTQRELHDFFDSNNNLVCSVFIQFNGMLGAMKKGGYTEEYWGDYQVYTGFTDLLSSYRARSATKKKKPEVEVYQSMFADRYRREDDDYTHMFLESHDGVIEEFLSIDDGSTEISYKTVAMKVKRTPKKRDELNYRAINTSTDEEHLVRRIVPLEIIMKKRDLSWQDTKDYRVITDNDDFLAWVRNELDPCNEIIGFDTETSGLQINRFSGISSRSDICVGLVFSTKADTSVYLPLNHKRFPNLDTNLVIDTLRPYMDRRYPGPKQKKYVTHNGSFDGKVMLIYDIVVNVVHDTFILSFMLNPKMGREKGLKFLTDKHLRIEMIELSDFFEGGRGKKKANIRFDLLSLEAVRRYACPDADNTKALLPILLAMLRQEQLFIYGHEIRLMAKVAEMEYYGFRVNMDRVRSEKAKALAKAEKVRERMFELAGGEFDMKSPKVLAEILFKKLGYEPLRYSEKTKEPSTDEATIRYLMKSDGDQEDKDDDKPEPGPQKLPKLLLKHRKALNLISKFFDKIIEDEINGYIFPKYNQAGTDTGRFSSSNPNIQQTSRGIREIFIPEDDFYFIIVDYSQVEYRILAGMAQEYDLIEQMLDPDADVHSLTASIMFGIPVEFVDKDMRKKGKEINFGSVYGMGIQSLAIRVFGTANSETLRQARELYETYFQRLPNITRFFNNVIERARINNYVGTYFNRLRPLENINSLDSGERSFDERRCKNTPIQGTAADIIKIAHNRLDDRLKAEKVNARVVGSVHDELIVQVHKSVNPWQFIQIAREEMELKIENFPPLYIGINVGTAWADGKNDGLEIPVQVSDRYIEEVKTGMHKEPYENPKSECQRIIQEYERKKIESIIHENNLHDKEDMLSNNQIKGIIDKYFYKKTDVIDAIMGDSEFFVELTEDMEYVSDKDSDARATQAYDEGAVAEYFNDVDEVPVLAEYAPVDLTNIAPRITDDYSVTVMGGSVFIKLTSPTKELVAEISEYLQAHNVKVGANVGILMGDGKIIATKYKLYHVDRVALLNIIEKHEIVYLRKTREALKRPHPSFVLNKRK